jgi:hypothetical protein
MGQQQPNNESKIMFDNVIVTAIEEFARENIHVSDRYGDPVWEKFVMIAMVGTDGQEYRTFTKFNRPFALEVKEIGQTFDLSAKVVENRGEYIKVGYCKIGQTKEAILAEKRAEKKAKTLAKLGL